MRKYDTIEEYIKDQPNYIRKVLKDISTVIHRTAPQAQATINYGIPTYKLNGKNLIHFGMAKHHIALYPGPKAVKYFEKELNKYDTSKGTIRFPLDNDLPYDLIAEITKYNANNRTN